MNTLANETKWAKAEGPPAGRSGTSTSSPVATDRSERSGKEQLAKFVWCFIKSHPRTAETLCNRMQLIYSNLKDELLFSSTRDSEKIVLCVHLISAYQIAVAQMGELSPEIVGDVKRELASIKRIWESEESAGCGRAFPDRLEGGISFLSWLQQVTSTHPLLRLTSLRASKEFEYETPKSVPPWKGRAEELQDLPRIVPLETPPARVRGTQESSASGVIRARDFLAKDDLFNAAINNGRGWKPSWAYGSS